MIRRAFPFLSHTLVAGAGWALVMMMRPPLPAPATESSSAATESRQATGKTRNRDSWQGDGGRLLRELAEKKDKLDDFSDIPPAPDRAAAAMAAIQAWRSDPNNDSLRREVCARLSHWIEADPKAAITYWNQQPIWPGPPFVEILASAVANLKPATLLTCLDTPSDSHLMDGRKLALIMALGKALAGTESSSQLADTLKTLQPSYGTTLLGTAIQAWPEDRLDALAPLIAGSNELDVLRAYCLRLPGNRQRAWLQSQFAGQMPTDPSQAAMLRALVAGATGLPLQERIDWMARLEAVTGKTSERPITSQFLVNNDITRFLNESNLSEDGLLGDWRHRLRYGQVTAAEVLAEVQRVLPAATNVEPDFLLNTVFKHVAQYAPEGAMGLLGGLPVAEREKLMLDSAFMSGGAGNPQALFDLVSTLPPYPGSVGNERFKVWIRAANPSVSSYGDSYAAWVLAMPHGVERDMALSALAGHFDPIDAERSATYRAAKTLPPGWKPGQK